MKSRIKILFTFIILAVIAFGVGRPEQADTKISDEPAKTTIRSIYSGGIKPLPLKNSLMDAKKVDSFADAEQLTNLSIQVPSKLFGKKAKIYVRGFNHVSIFYSNTVDPVMGDGVIHIGRRESGLASYELLAEQWEIENAAIFLREHKGYSGYVIEDRSAGASDHSRNRPAGVVWLADGVQHMIVAPEGMSYKKLIEITDDLE